MHPSLLPRYRGPAPIQHALLDGEQESGVCVIEMLNVKAGAVDSGDIWGCEKMVRTTNRLGRKVYTLHQKIPDGATFRQLRDALGKQGGDLLVSVLRQMSRFEVCHSVIFCFLLFFTRSP